MNPSPNYVIKSFKHDGHLHRMWLENWRVPQTVLYPEHAAESMIVFVNSQTRIQEADGRQWTSKIPGVSFFIPGEWFNAIGLIEDGKVRYYCNVASPPYVNGNVLTYIDYDLDILIAPNGGMQLVDEDEFERHKTTYRYNQSVLHKIRSGLDNLRKRISEGRPPFVKDAVLAYYESWLEGRGEVPIERDEG